MVTHAQPPAPPTPRPWPAVAAAFAAMFVGIGLARFAYTPLIPAIIAADWFGADEAAYLGAANLAGYLAGALIGARLARAFGTAWPARALMLTTTLSFLACALPLSFTWFFAWRFVAGLTGGALMVMAAPSALKRVPAARRGLAAGIIFAGVGLGIAASGTLTPLLLAVGLAEAWIAFGAIALVVTLATWTAWPTEPAAAAPTTAPGSRWPPAAILVIAAYGLIAAGLVPHMVFLADYAARGLGGGVALGATLWVLFGIGATAGPPLAGAVADRIGFTAALALALALEAGATAILLASEHIAVLAVSSIAVGAFVPGCVPLVIGRLGQTIADPARQQTAWSRATAVFALGQAGAAYLMSFVFAHVGSHRPLFALGAGAFVAALALSLAAAAAARRHGGKPRSVLQEPP